MWYFKSSIRGTPACFKGLPSLILYQEKKGEREKERETKKERRERKMKKGEGRQGGGRK